MQVARVQSWALRLVEVDLGHRAFLVIRAVKEVVLGRMPCFIKFFRIVFDSINGRY